MFQFIYSQLIRLALPFILIRLWWQGRKAPALRLDWQPRLGWVPEISGPVIWVHAVSVGETIAAGPLVRRLLARNLGATILMTAMTDTGLAQARKMFGDRVTYAYAPYDTPGAIRRYLDRINPRILVILETEIWPNMIRQCRRRRVPVFLINARLSERSAKGYERVKGLAVPIMKSITWVAAQAERDAERFRRIGVAASHVEVTGSVKFDVDIPDDVREASRRLREQLGRRPVWIAGSTHSGEDQQLLEAHRLIMEHHPKALLIIVPRHPDRFDSVAELAEKEGFVVARRSSGQEPGQAQVYLGDTMGELMMLYGASDMAFVGGSLIERGGHNPLEPAAWGIPVFSGPHVFNFETIFERLLADHGVQVVAEAASLAKSLDHLMSDDEKRREYGEQALSVVRKNRGALDKVVEGIIERL
ncbi:lipid IV(A) 3-deoxy-D-manno-octulosonic acid transferase [Marinobacter daepoensis]|uniref:3-deoxy-D-manno-octulosonic acid transferase n=1 Tax=Marinobacter daepoensis TaxID=262077 RepID=A0ABS3BGV7_9GAMM|nr:lipid IV(A) 3-deoxy-D-manno-octulosonic acid transferase [Marinobacter daepoensis]MBN7770560.1 lipid IV(A) 3-deoxy-D-manno-octulosonic acid transferase [Marinobacter daepoensis]MBY6034669.1 lipid IV(A) 3-deoxy-D-manno-octulosonic acid transferase [Marinobacter daepoensis]MBY6080502.1 lipid IV(A) 3-deoxy-D-manno-octulosonic acid transferase [Marinobacter daepoensis]